MRKENELEALESTVEKFLLLAPTPSVAHDEGAFEKGDLATKGFLFFTSVEAAHQLRQKLRGLSDPPPTLPI